jgi:hypothetical protein
VERRTFPHNGARRKVVPALVLVATPYPNARRKLGIIRAR